MRITLIAVLASLLGLTLSLRVSQHAANPPNDIIVGGYQALSLKELPDDAKAVDDYLRAQHPSLKDATLTSASRQVVAGFNYRYIYESADGKKQWDMVVYKNLKGNLYENGYKYTETLPNGQKVVAMADPASAFTGGRSAVKISATPTPPQSL